jgi:predicted RNA-binding Zn-ribbon protein involved in translation (DUF1610 family)
MEATMPPSATDQRHCPHCGKTLWDSQVNDYACPFCGRFLDRLYRAEHLDPERGKRLTILDILREYQLVGFPPPGWLP